jgi:hypothetical protein
MDNVDFWSVAVAFVIATPLGLLAVWAVERHQRKRVPKWNNWPRPAQPR